MPVKLDRLHTLPLVMVESGEILHEDQIFSSSVERFTDVSSDIFNRNLDFFMVLDYYIIFTNHIFSVTLKIYKKRA